MGGGRRRRGTVGGVLPKRLKYGSSDHLPDVCAFQWPLQDSVRPLGLLHLAVLFPECPLCTWCPLCAQHLFLSDSSIFCSGVFPLLFFPFLAFSLFSVASGLSYACVLWLIFFRSISPAGELMYSLTTCDNTNTRSCPYFSLAYLMRTILFFCMDSVLILYLLVVCHLSPAQCSMLEGNTNQHMNLSVSLATNKRNLLHGPNIPSSG